MYINIVDFLYTLFISLVTIQIFQTSNRKLWRKN